MGGSMDKFSYEENGYNKKELNKFISDVITQTEAIISKCKLYQKGFPLSNYQRIVLFPNKNNDQHWLIVCEILGFDYIVQNIKDTL